jgi:Cu/Ag efflux protein CusF
MKEVLATVAACLLLGTGGASTLAQNTEMQNPQAGLESMRSTTGRATVQEIDHQNRMVTLKGENGKVFTVKVPEEARNFNQIQKGDQVTFRREESLALGLRKPNEPATSGEQQTMMRAPAGAKPGGALIKTTQVTATVEKIDRQNREVTLRGPEGNTKRLKVPSDVQAFDRLQQGDQVIATYTDAFMIDVTSPNK